MRLNSSLSMDTFVPVLSEIKVLALLNGKSTVDDPSPHSPPLPIKNIGDLFLCLNPLPRPGTDHRDFAKLKQIIMSTI